MNAFTRRDFGLCLAGTTLGGLSTTTAATAQNAGIIDTAAVVKGAAAAIRREYVDPEKANALADTLLQNLSAGKYAGVSGHRALADALTQNLRGLTNDLHMSVSYDPEEPGSDAPDAIAEDDLHPRVTAYGIQTVARLPGNIGLIRITHFPSPPEKFAARYGAAMEILQDTYALVIDLTVNHGGGADTEAYFMSYFLDREQELGRVIFRHEPAQVVRTYGHVEGPRYGETRPVFVAVSNNTFSAGEALAAHLKARRRAVLVGRRTRGGAHIGDFFKLAENMSIFIVTGRSAENNWEGTGVPPDNDVEPEFAVVTAYRMALDATIKVTTDEKIAQVLRNVGNHSIENLSSFLM